MDLSSIQLKRRALGALKGNWQTALLVSFFAGAAAVVAGLLEPSFTFDPAAPNMEALWRSITDSLAQIPVGTWVLWGSFCLVQFILQPVLELGSCHYFVCRLKGEELGFMGLFSRMRLLGKAILLGLYVGIKIFLWSLLLFIPGIIAAFRYVMAPYYLAEDPSLSVVEAVEKSKNAMRYTKLSYFSLILSFFGWALLIFATQYFLVGVNMILSLVVYQFLSLWLSAYENAAFAAFFLAVSQQPEPVEAEGENP